MYTKLRTALTVLIVFASFSATLHADIIEEGHLNIIYDPGNNSDGLAYLDLSYSMGMTRSEALANARTDYPNARLATPNEFSDLFDASGLLYYTGYRGGTMADLFPSADIGYTVTVSKYGGYNRSLLLDKLNDVFSIPGQVRNVLIWGLPHQSTGYFNELSIYDNGMYISYGGTTETKPDPSCWLTGWLIVVPTETVFVGGLETGIPNAVVAPGSTIQDRVDAIEAEVGINHGRYLRNVVHLTDELLTKDLIDQDQADIMVICASESEVGKE